MENLIGERIKQLREENNLSQDDLGKAIGISRISIGYYERGNRKPDSDMIDKLCNYFDVDADYLLGRSSIRKDDFKQQNDKIKLLSISQQKEINELTNSITDTVMRYKNTDLRLSDRLTDEIIPHLYRQLIAFNYLLDNVKEAYDKFNNEKFDVKSLSDYLDLLSQINEKADEINAIFESTSRFEAIMGKLYMRIIVQDSFLPIQAKAYKKLPK